MELNKESFQALSDKEKYLENEKEIEKIRKINPVDDTEEEFAEGMKKASILKSENSAIYENAHKEALEIERNRNSQVENIATENVDKGMEVDNIKERFFENRERIIKITDEMGNILADENGSYEIPRVLEYKDGKLEKIVIRIISGRGKLSEILHEKAVVDMKRYEKNEDFMFRENDEYIVAAYNNPESEEEKEIKPLLDKFFNLKMKRREYIVDINENLEYLGDYYKNIANIYQFVYGREFPADLDEDIAKFDWKEVEEYISSERKNGTMYSENYMKKIKAYADTYKKILMLLKEGIYNILSIDSNAKEIDNLKLSSQLIIENIFEMQAMLHVNSGFEVLSEGNGGEFGELFRDMEKFKGFNLFGIKYRIDEVV